MSDLSPLCAAKQTSVSGFLWLGPKLTRQPGDDLSHRPVTAVSGSFPRLPDRPGLGGLVEQLIQLPGPHGRDEGIDYRRQLVLGRDDDAGLALLELDGPRA